MAIRISKIFIALSLLSVVLVSSENIFPFIGIKAYWFRTAVAVSFIFILFWLGFKSGNRDFSLIKQIFSSPIVLAVTIFFSVFILSSFLAYNSNSAFWSNFERGEGAFQMIFYYLFFLILVFLLRNNKDWKFIFTIMAAAAILVIGYGVLAAIDTENDKIFTTANLYDRDKIFFGPSGIDGILSQRFWGSLGNAAYTGSYLLFALFFLGFSVLLKNSDKLKKILFLSAGVPLIIIFLFLTQTRGAFLGLIFGILAFLSYYAFSVPSSRKFIIPLFFVFIVAGTGIFYFKNTSFIKDLPVVGRLSRISVFDHSFQTRIWTWQTAYKGWKQRPILGWGPENFSNIYNSNFDTRHFVPGENSDTWYDRAHSVFFDYLAETGILGLLSYLGIFFVFYWRFFKAKSALSPPESALLFAFPVAYLIQGMVLFETLPIYISFFLFLAFAVYKLDIKEGEIIKKQKEFSLGENWQIKSFATALIGLLVISIYFGSYLPYQKSKLGADKIAEFYFSYASGKRINLALLKESFNEPIDYYSPIGQEETINNITDVFDKIIEISAQKSGINISEMVDYAENANKKILEKEKAFNLTKILFNLGKMNHRAFLKTGDKKFIETAENYYKKCLIESPRRPQCLYGLFDVYRVQKNKSTDAIKVGKEILSYWPSDDSIRAILNSIADRP